MSAPAFRDPQVADDGDSETSSDEFCVVTLALDPDADAATKTVPQTTPIPPPAAPVGRPAADGDRPPVTLRCTAEYTEALTKEDKLVVMAEVEAAEMEVEAEAKRSAVELCAVIDRSGSMRGKKLALVLKSLEFVIHEMSRTDKISIIAYDQRVTRVLPLTQMTARNKATALQQLKSIKPGGSTNLSGGLISGIREMRDADTAAGRSKAVWLFTDGHANVGIKDTPGLLDAVHGALGDGDRAAAIYTFGFGESHNEEMLRAVSEAGGGMYYFIEKAEDVAGCFAECLGGLMTLAARKLSVQFLPAAGVEVERVLGEASGKAKTYSDLFAGETRNVLFELKLRELQKGGPQTLGQALLTYTDMKDVEEKVSAVVKVERVAAYTSARMRDSDVANNRLRLETLEGMKRATAWADAGNYEAATNLARDLKVRVSEVSVKVKAKSSKSRSEEVALQLDDDLDCMIDDINPTAWKNKGKKKMTNVYQSHGVQRSAQGKASAKPEGYMTNMQQCLMAKAALRF